MRVLIVRLGAFGDLIHTLPLAADLKRAGHRVAWCCEDRWQAVLDGSPAIEALHLLPRKHWQRASTPRRQRRQDLRQLVRQIGHQDVVIDAQGLLKSAWVARHIDADSHIAHARPRAREATWLLPATRCPADATHVIDQQRALGLPLTGTGRPFGGWTFPLPAWATEQTWADNWLAEHNLDRPWVLNVGAGWPTKVWPEANQTAFAERCASAGRQLVVVWGSPAEEQIANTIGTVVSGSIIAPRTTIPELGALLRRAGGLVSGDTGPLHLGVAVGCPAVGLFGPVPGERNGPRGSFGCFLQAPGAAWERRDVSKVAMDQIGADQVFDALALRCR